MNVYLVRHGESEGNLKRFYQKADIQLSSDGKKQSKLLTERLKSYLFDVVYASPFLRARQTADIVVKELKIPVEYLGGLRERKRPSELEGLSVDNSKSIEINSQIAKNWSSKSWKYSDEDNFEELRKRGQEVVNYLLEKHKGHNVLCISHGIIIKILVCVVIFGEKLNPEIFWEFNSHTLVENTGITHLEFTEKHGWKVLGWNNTTHL